MPKLLIEGENDFLELVKTDVCKNSGSFGFSVRIQSGKFSGELENVYFFESNFDRLLVSLRNLNCSRQGSARIEAFDPNEFWLEILSVDKLGHIHAQGRLTHVTCLRNERLWTSVGFDIPLDPTSFPKLVKQFERFGWDPV